jgi:hypothetical protein
MVVWQGCSGVHGGNHGANHDNGFLIGGVVAGMQISSCFVVSARVKCTKKLVVNESAKLVSFLEQTKQEDKHVLIVD